MRSSKMDGERLEEVNVECFQSVNLMIEWSAKDKRQF